MIVGSLSFGRVSSQPPPAAAKASRTDYCYPKIEDFQRLVLKCGQGCFLFKRDFSRYYLQLPLDPTEYRLTGVVW